MKIFWDLQSAELFLWSESWFWYLPLTHLWHLAVSNCWSVQRQQFFVSIKTCMNACMYACMYVCICCGLKNMKIKTKVGTCINAKFLFCIWPIFSSEAVDSHLSRTRTWSLSICQCLVNEITQLWSPSAHCNQYSLIYKHGQSLHLKETLDCRLCLDGKCLAISVSQTAVCCGGNFVITRFLNFGCSFQKARVFSLPYMSRQYVRLLQRFHAVECVTHLISWCHRGVTPLLDVVRNGDIMNTMELQHFLINRLTKKSWSLRWDIQCLTPNSKFGLVYFSFLFEKLPNLNPASQL